MGKTLTVLLLTLLSGLTEHISTTSTTPKTATSPCADVGMCCPGTNDSCSTIGSFMFSDGSGNCYCDEICIQNQDCCVDYNKTCREPLDILSFKSSKSVLREGKSAWFQLEMANLVEVGVKWLRNGILISNTSSRYILTSSRTINDTIVHMLRIPSVLQRDEGFWVVQASKGTDTATRSVRIQVLPRLLLKLVPEYDFVIQSSEEIKLQCVVINPISLLNLTAGHLTWQKDENDVLSDNGTNITKGNVSTSLRKASAKINDSGNYSCSHSSYPDSVIVSITITVIPPGQIICSDEKVDSIIWNATISGTTKTESCPENQKGTATRYCDTRGNWEEPNLINCTDVVLLNASKELDNLIADGVKDTEKVQETVEKTLVTMRNLTSQTDVLSAGDISSSLDILEKIVNVINLTSANIKKEVFFEVVDNVLSTNNSKSWTTVSDKTRKDGSTLLRSMDRLIEVLFRKDYINTTKFIGENFEVTVNRAKLDKKGIIFPENSDKHSNDTSKDIDEYSTFLELPKQGNMTIEAFTYVAVIYKTVSEFLPADSSLEREENADQVKEGKEKKKAFVNSEILSLTTQTDLGILSPPLNLAFQHKQTNERAINQAVCVSWNFTINKWSEEGCKVYSTNNKRTVCQCTHLTNFAILMRPYTSEKKDKASLKTLSLIGVILSIMFTVLTFIIFLLTWKHIRSEQNIMLLNLCGSLVLSYTVFIAAVEKTNIEAFCIFITAIIHYLFLVTFFCMLSMGIYYFMSITVTFYAMYIANNFKSKPRVHFFLLGSWGLPLIITLITLGAFWGEDYHINNYCWLSVESGSLYMFIVPVCLIAVINIIIMVSLIRVLCTSSAMTKSSLQRKAASGLRSLGTLVPVLGVTWIFGVLAVNDSTEIFQYIFIVANSLQGFCIFVAHVLLNRKLIQGLKTNYPTLSGLSMFTESSKKEISSVSRTQSSRSETQESPLIKPKGFLSTFGKLTRKRTPMTLKVKKSDSFLTAGTVSTDCSGSVSQAKNLEMTENGPKDKEIKMNFKEEKMERKKPRVCFNINLKKKTYTVTET